MFFFVTEARVELATHSRVTNLGGWGGHPVTLYSANFLLLFLLRQPYPERPTQNDWENQETEQEQPHIDDSPCLKTVQRVYRDIPDGKQTCKHIVDNKPNHSFLLNCNVQYLISKGKTILFSRTEWSIISFHEVKDVLNHGIVHLAEEQNLVVRISYVAALVVLTDAYLNDIRVASPVVSVHIHWFAEKILFSHCSSSLI